MKYVYLNSQHSTDHELQANDVGIVLFDHGENLLLRYLREHRDVVTPRADVVFFNVKSTGDEFDFKICDRCFKHLNTQTDFENNRIKKGGKITKRPSCRECRKDKNGISVSPAERSKWEKTKPLMYSSFTCPICDKTTIAGISKIVLDHCHKTGTVRGWVCESCNTGIGRFDDDPDIVYKAIEWLLKKD